MRRFLQRFQKRTKKQFRGSWRAALRYLGAWLHFGSILFLRSIVTSRPSEDNTEDPEFFNIIAAPANEYDNEDAQFQEKLMSKIATVNHRICLK
jgi:hypothetical protein